MLTAMMCDQGSATSARSFAPRNSPASTVEARAPSNARLESAAPLGKPLVPDVWKIARSRTGRCCTAERVFALRQAAARAEIHPGFPPPGRPESRCEPAAAAALECYAQRPPCRSPGSAFRWSARMRRTSARSASGSAEPRCLRRARWPETNESSASCWCDKQPPTARGAAQPSGEESVDRADLGVHSDRTRPAHRHRDFAVSIAPQHSSTRLATVTAVAGEPVALKRKGFIARAQALRPQSLATQ
jgi:hypothetical protein